MSTHQRSLDNLGNNLSNINTVGYRKSDYMFTNILNQVMTGSMAAAENRTSTSAKALGLGAATGAILNNFTQGPIEGTGNKLDVAISGSGFFLASTPSGMALTRNGSFYLDHLVDPNQRMLCVGNGLAVQGWNAVNGVVTPTAESVGNIYLPAQGDILPGKTTTKVDFKGILPTNTSSADFNGSVTNNLELKGNLPSGNNSLTTTIYAPVTRTDGTTTEYKDEIQEIKVEITFDGPTLSADGSVNGWNWVMKTVDWPNPGDPGVQIYPPLDDPNFSQGTVQFYTEGSVANQRGAGQVVDATLNPGSSKVSTSVDDGQGGTVTSSFTIPTDFRMDVSRLTSVPNAPGGAALETWSVNGNPKGTMSRTVTVFDEYTEFVAGTDAAGNSVMQAVRRVEARENVFHFTKADQDDAGTTWTWKSSLDGATGSLRFNTIGDLVQSNSTGGSVSYDFSDVRHINSEGALQVIGQDGFRDGFLTEVSIDQYGKVFGHYTNDVIEPLAQLAMATVPNPSGLEGVSGTLFYTGAASGGLMIGVPGDNEGARYGLASIGAGSLVTQSLEGSNVDLSREFTDLITIERGYQLNGKVITTSDEMLQTALGIKR